MKLSKAYLTQEKDVSLELIVEVFNINVGYNEELKKASKTLSDYATYVQRIRDYRSKGFSIEGSVERAIEECIKDGILKEFLMKNKAEAMAVSIYEYNEEEHMRMEREQHYEDGLKEGEILGAISMCRDFKLSEDEIVAKLVEKYGLQEDVARKYCK